MLGVSLILVGILLVSNGICFLSKVKTQEGELVPLVVKSPKTIAFFNVIVGGILLIINIVNMGVMSRGNSGHLLFQNTAAGFIFGITYLFVAGNLLFKLEGKPFGIFCTGATIFAGVLAVDNFIHLARAGLTEGYHSLILAILWLFWLVLWLSGAIQFLFKSKRMERAFPFISIIVGVVSAFGPALALLLGWWPLL